MSHAIATCALLCGIPANAIAQGATALAGAGRGPWLVGFGARLDSVTIDRALATGAEPRVRDVLRESGVDVDDAGRSEALGTLLEPLADMEAACAVTFDGSGGATQAWLTVTGDWGLDHAIHRIARLGGPGEAAHTALRRFQPFDVTPGCGVDVAANGSLRLELSYVVEFTSETENGPVAEAIAHAVSDVFSAVPNGAARAEIVGAYFRKSLPAYRPPPGRYSMIVRIRGTQGAAPDEMVIDIPAIQNRFALTALQSLGYDVAGLELLGTLQGMLDVKEINGHIWVERFRIIIRESGATAELYYAHEGD